MNIRKMALMILCGMAVIIINISAANSQQITGQKTIQNYVSKQNTVNEGKEEDKGEQQEMGKAAQYIDNGSDVLQTGYLYQQKEGGRIEKFTYQTVNYVGDGESYQKNAMVYLPKGYDPADQEKKYDVFYLMHGSGCDEQWYFGDGEGEYDMNLKCILDHMIDNGEIPPCIVCTPSYKNPYAASEQESVEYFPQEFQKDLIPQLEEKYHSYYDATSVSDSRWHRIFGGFSMGAATTWWIFEQCMDAVAKYIPVSGDSWCGGSTGEKKVIHLTEAVQKQGYTEDDFLLYYGCGDKGDIAYNNVVSQVKAMKMGTGIFKYCQNYQEGNFYFNMIENGGHDIDTVCSVIYSGLIRMLGKPRTEQRYYQWAESIMVDKEPKVAAKKDSTYYYGKWKKYAYYSQTAKRQTNVNVLLPPNYSKEEIYPVLYLLHGYYDNEDWMAGESVELKMILGNLINYGMAREMIVVAPYIYCSAEQETCTEMNLENSLCYDNFVNDLLLDLKPFIEKKFSVKTGRENTAIAGFSMGGREAVYIAVKHADLFGYVGAVCPAPGLMPGSDLSQHPGQLKEEELVFPEGQEPYLFLLSAAKTDPAVGKNPFMLHNLLEQNQVQHLWNVIPEGGHDAGSVRVHLYNYLRMIFRNNS